MFEEFRGGGGWSIAASIPGCLVVFLAVVDTGPSPRVTFRISSTRSRQLRQPRFLARAFFLSSVFVS